MFIKIEKVVKSPIKVGDSIVQNPITGKSLRHQNISTKSEYVNTEEITSIRPWGIKPGSDEEVAFGTEAHISVLYMRGERKTSHKREDRKSEDNKSPQIHILESPESFSKRANDLKAKSIVYGPETKA